VPYGTDIKALSPRIILSGNAAVSPLSEVKTDFTLPIDYTVTAENGSSECWKVTCIVDNYVPIIGDFDGNGKIDILDLASLAINYNCKLGDSYWDAKYDLNKDYILDIYDMVILSKKINY